METLVVFLEQRHSSLTGKVWDFCLQWDWPWFISLVYILNFQVTYWILPSDRRESVCVEQSHAPTRNWLPWHIIVFRHWWPSSGKWKEEWWARLPDRHTQLNTFECALFVLIGIYLHFSPEKPEPTVTFFNSHRGSLGLMSWSLLLSSGAVLEPWLGRRDFGQCEAPRAVTGETLSWCGISTGWGICVWAWSRKVRGSVLTKGFWLSVDSGCDSGQDFCRNFLSPLKFARLCTWPSAADYSKHQQKWN